MAYKLDNFLGSISTSDRLIKIYDDKDLLVRTIDPFKVVTTQATNNVVIIKTKTSSILLDFATTTEARLALEKLQGYINSLTVNTSPLFVEKYLSNYVTIFGASGSSGPQGPTGPPGNQGFTGGTISVSGDLVPSLSNIYNLGTYSSRWNILYGDTINLNGLTFSSDGSSFSFAGDLLPAKNQTYNLGSPTFEWHTLYVGSQSLVIGGVTLSSHDGSILMSSINLGNIDSPVYLTSENGTILSTSTASFGSIIIDNEGDIIRNGESVLYRYSGTSTTPLQLPNTGYIIELNTQDRLGFRQGQSLIVYNTIENVYAVDDYVDDSGAYFVGEVTGYSFYSGLLELVVNYSSGFGLTNNDGIVPTYSFWNIEISPSNYSGGVNITNPANNGLVTSDGDTGIIAHNNLTFDGYTFSIEATTKFQQTIEVLNTSTASSNIIYDFNLGSIWFHDDLSDDFQAEFENVPENDMKVITATIMIEQSSNAYLPTSPILINGNSYNIKWIGANSPSGNANQTDVVGFSFVRRNNDWSVLAQMSTFG